MVRIFCFLLGLLAALSGCGQADSLFQPRTDTLLLPLGDTTVRVHKSQYGTAPAPFFVHLHHNERTADSAARFFLQRRGGWLLSLQSRRQRVVAFGANGARYLVDPNRIFTAAGASQSLKLLSTLTPAAAASVLAFGDSLLSLIPDSIPLISVHNNTPGAYSIRSYEGGSALAAEAAAVFRNPEMDPDDFVLTTDVLLFEALRTAGINVVLQFNAQAADDGSLGFVCGRQGHSYTNVEAEHGHLAEQLRLLEAVVRALAQY